MAAPIVVVDSHKGNLLSVVRGLSEVGGEASISDDPAAIAGASGIVLPGVGSTLAAWLVLSMAFSYYVEHVGQYSVLYGSIATVIVVLLWLYMSGQILVLGAEFSAALIDRETTAAPLGEEEDK